MNEFVNVGKNLLITKETTSTQARASAWPCVRERPRLLAGPVVDFLSDDVRHVHCGFGMISGVEDWSTGSGTGLVTPSTVHLAKCGAKRSRRTLVYVAQRSAGEVHDTGFRSLIEVKEMSSAPFYGVRSLVLSELHRRSSTRHFVAPRLSTRISLQTDRFSRD